MAAVCHFGPHFTSSHTPYSLGGLAFLFTPYSLGGLTFLFDVSIPRFVTSRIAPKSFLSRFPLAERNWLGLPTPAARVPYRVRAPYG